MKTGHLKVLAIVTALAAVLFGFLAYQFASRVEQVEVVTVVEREVVPRDWTAVAVATRPLPRGQAIAPDAVLLVPVQIAPPDAFLNLKEVVGLTPTMPVGAGEPVTNRHFYQGSTLVRTLGEDERAMAILVNEAIGVGGFLEPGDYVDVLLYLSADRAAERPARTRIVLPRQRLLAYGGAVEGDAPARDPRTAARTAVIAVHTEDAPKLLLASHVGSLHLSLHGIDPGSVAEGLPITLTELEALAVPKVRTPPVKRPPPVAPKPPTRDVTTIWLGTQKSTVVH